MKDSQPETVAKALGVKYIKANNERFSTVRRAGGLTLLSISRRIMKDSQQISAQMLGLTKYIKANNERFSTLPEMGRMAT